MAAAVVVGADATGTDTSTDDAIDEEEDTGLALTPF